ncbi:MAG: hypothetical protein ACI87W_001394 [Halieaceae bacterium]|jgi:hypothetical protein
MTEMNHDKLYAYPQLARHCEHLIEAMTSALHIKLIERLCAALLLASVLMVSPSSAEGDPDPADPIGNMAIEMGMACSSTDPSQPQYYVWTGKLYSRRVGEPDRHLFNVQGINPRACKMHNNPERGGLGFQTSARELMLYLHPDSNEVLRTWENPWTGDVVEVMHMYNDPASAPLKFPLDNDGKPISFRFKWIDSGAFLIAEHTRASFRDSPMGGDYQSYVGGHYHSFETSSMIIDKGDVLRSADGSAIPYVATWTRISQWLPWMMMGGRDGSIVLSSSGRGTLNFNDLPQPLRQVVESHYPQMTVAPPFDDERPFVNSWKSTKRWIDERREKNHDR